MSFAEYREILRYEIDKAEGEIIKSNNVENKQALKEDFESQYSRSLLWYLDQHYKNNKNIVLVSVSLEKNRDAWKNLLKKDNPQWPQYIVKARFCLSMLLVHQKTRLLVSGSAFIPLYYKKKQ